MDCDFEPLKRDFESLERDFESLEPDFESLNCDFESLERDFESLVCDYESLNCDFESLDCDFESLVCDFETGLCLQDYSSIKKIFSSDTEAAEMEPKFLDLNQVSTQCPYLHKFRSCVCSGRNLKVANISCPESKLRSSAL